LRLDKFADRFVGAERYSPKTLGKRLLFIESLAIFSNMSEAFLKADIALFAKFKDIRGK
jgi:hypothetical protein